MQACSPKSDSWCMRSNSLNPYNKGKLLHIPAKKTLTTPNWGFWMELRGPRSFSYKRKIIKRTSPSNPRTYGIFFCNKTLGLSMPPISWQMQLLLSPRSTPLVFRIIISAGTTCNATMKKSEYLPLLNNSNHRGEVRKPLTEVWLAILYQNALISPIQHVTQLWINCECDPVASYLISCRVDSPSPSPSLSLLLIMGLVSSVGARSGKTICPDGDVKSGRDEKYLEDFHINLLCEVP